LVDAGVWVSPADWLIYVIVLTVFFLGLLAAGLIIWRIPLEDALGEETALTERDALGMPYSVDGIVAKKVELRMSSSRVIAFVGMIAIFGLFLGFGVFSIWCFARTGQLPAAIEGICKLLLAGAVLFVPYLINRLSTIFLQN
jgi:hypothetical protein